MPLINCRVKLKPKWKKHGVLALAGVDNDDANFNNIIFTITDTNILVHAVILSTKVNQKLQGF